MLKDIYDMNGMNDMNDTKIINEQFLKFIHKTLEEHVDRDALSIIMEYLKDPLHNHGYIVRGPTMGFIGSEQFLLCRNISGGAVYEPQVFIRVAEKKNLPFPEFRYSSSIMEDVYFFMDRFHIIPSKRKSIINQVNSFILKALTTHNRHLYIILTIKYGRLYSLEKDSQYMWGNLTSGGIGHTKKPQFFVSSFTFR